MQATVIYSGTTIPSSVPFNVSRNDQVMVISGSMYFQGNEGLAAADILVDGNPSGTIAMFQNGIARHIAFPTVFIPLTLQTGRDHYVAFNPHPGTTSDGNDTFNIYLLE